MPVALGALKVDSSTTRRFVSLFNERIAIIDSGSLTYKKTIVSILTPLNELYIITPVNSMTPAFMPFLDRKSYEYLRST